jgi:octaprenyl-diphosphate synthase
LTFCAHALGQWGDVLVGDFLLGQAFRMMVESARCARSTFFSSAATIAEGEVTSLRLPRTPPPRTNISP